jgi:hypothetical protein
VGEEGLGPQRGKRGEKGVRARRRLMKRSSHP